MDPYSRQNTALTESKENINELYAQQHNDYHPEYAHAQQQIEIVNNFIEPGPEEFIVRASQPTSDEEFMAAWFVNHNVPEAAANELLQFLSTKIDGMPKDVMHLKTAKTYAPINTLADGAHVHFAAIKAMIKKSDEQQKAMNTRLLEELCFIKKELVGLKRQNVHGVLSNAQIIPTTPFKQMKDFLIFEKSLEDVDNLNKFKIELVEKGRKIRNIGKFMKITWSKIMTDDVAIMFSWRGTADKKCVRSLHTALAIRHTVINDLQGEESDFIKGCKAFFQFAKHRSQSKKKIK